jgi:hypothetical protein
MPIRPGSFSSAQTDYTGFTNSMADEIEQQLNALLALDGLPGLPADPGDREVRDRRRLFVAIARAVVKHLNDHRDAIDIEVPDGLGGTVTVNPTFQTEGL